MNPLLLDILLYFQSKELIDGDGIDAFRDFSPEEPNDTVVLVEYAGDPQVPFTHLVNRSVQVFVRSTDANKAREKAQELYKVLFSEEETRQIHFTEQRWGQVYLRQSPGLLRRDDSGRTVYFFNIGVTTTID